MEIDYIDFVFPHSLGINEVRCSIYPPRFSLS